MSCDCGGTVSEAAPSGGGGWTIRLPNGAHVGVYPTRATAEAERRRVYSGAGTVVQR